MTQETEDVVGAGARIQTWLAGMRVDQATALTNGRYADLWTLTEAASKCQSLSDRIDVLARERDHWKAECKALCDVVSEHTKARAALHQEGIKEGSDGRPDAA